jgi:hypothetical protein
MVEYRPFTRKPVTPADIIDAAKTLPLGQVCTYSWFDRDWCAPDKYLQWAQAELLQASETGYNSAIIYAKLVCARIIDGLIHTYYQMKTVRRLYPEKIERLKELGIVVPDVIRKWVFEPRNNLEHSYKLACKEDAERAVQLAQLFVGAMRQEIERPPIVTVGWNVMGWELHRVQSDVTVHFDGFSENPMLFIDVLDDPILVKVVHPRDGEVQYAPLRDFGENECLTLGKMLREHWSLPNRSQSSLRRYLISDLKKRGYL